MFSLIASDRSLKNEAALPTINVMSPIISNVKVPTLSKSLDVSTTTTYFPMPSFVKLIEIAEVMRTVPIIVKAAERRKNFTPKLKAFPHFTYLTVEVSSIDQTL